MSHLSHCSLVNKAEIQKIQIVIGLITIFTIFEIWGHLTSNSLSLLADALHLIIDILGFCISLVALYIAKKSPNSKYPFGYQRVEVFGAITSTLFIWVIALYLIYKSMDKYLHPELINSKIFTSVSVVGLIVNLICLGVLHIDTDKGLIKNLEKECVISSGKSHNTHSPVEITSNGKYNNLSSSSHHSCCNLNNSKRNLNLKAAAVHVIGDVIQSIGVIIASIVIGYNPQWYIADLICTFIFAILVFVSTIPILKECFHILTEGAPIYIDQDYIKSYILEEVDSNILAIDDLKCWSITNSNIGIAIKVSTASVNMSSYVIILNKIQKFLYSDLKINYTIVQLNTPEITKLDSVFEI